MPGSDVCHKNHYLNPSPGETEEGVSESLICYRNPLHYLILRETLTKATWYLSDESGIPTKLVGEYAFVTFSVVCECSGRGTHI